MKHQQPNNNTNTNTNTNGKEPPDDDKRDKLTFISTNSYNQALINSITRNPRSEEEVKAAENMEEVHMDMCIEKSPPESQLPVVKKKGNHEMGTHFDDYQQDEEISSAYDPLPE